MNTIELDNEMNRLQKQIDECDNDNDLAILEDNMRALQNEWYDTRD